MVIFDDRRLRRYFRPVLKFFYLEVPGILVISTLLFSCALYTPSSSDVPVTTTCSVPADQSGTISGHWTIKPIPIAFHQGDFTSTEMLAMTNAADTWNAFYTASQGFPVIDYGGNASSPRLSAATDVSQGGGLCANGIVQGATSTFDGNVVIYKLGSWPYAASAIALTSFCDLAATPLPNFYMALMEINYQGYFVAGTGKYPDLQSIVLHELGHVLGLNHSCEAFVKTGTPNCNETNLDPDYSLASMFPSFGFGAGGVGQVKQSLGTNDESRANCLYSPSPTASATPTTSH